MATVIEIMLRPSPSNWLVRLLSIEGQVSQAEGQVSSLIQDRLASRDNLRVIASLNDVSCFPTLIEEDSGCSAPALASMSAFQFPGMSQCSGAQVSVTLKRPERSMRQRRYSLTILELFATFDRDFIAACLSEKVETRVKEHRMRGSLVRPGRFLLLPSGTRCTSAGVKFSSPISQSRLHYAPHNRVWSRRYGHSGVPVVQSC